MDVRVANGPLDGSKPMLIHVEIPLEDSLLEGIRYLGRLGYLSSGRLHNRHALSAMMLSGRA